MKKNIENERGSNVGTHLKWFVKIASFGGLFLSLIGTGLIWAGASSFNCKDVVWESALAFNFFIFIITWIIYIPFKKTDRLIGHGLLSALALFGMFWLFGFGGFYFYFLFSPINIFVRSIVIVIFTAILILRAFTVMSDIKVCFQKNRGLFSEIYRDELEVFTYNKDAFISLQNAKKDRNPFHSYHLYAALVVAPFVMVLNRLLTPVLGDGHGVFLILAFFSAPMLLFGIDIFTQTIMTMVYYPIKIQQETGKPVLLKGW